MCNDTELIEEGAGFGTPVVKYQDKTYFSISARSVKQVEGNRQTLTKSYIMNAVSRKKVGNSAYINERFYSFFHALFHKAYVGHKNQALFFNRIMELRRLLRVKTYFLRADPRGVITVKYVCLKDKIDIEVSLSKLNKSGCREILILNEQGATFFRKYSDTSGSTLIDESIGAWEEVRADEAGLSDDDDTITFALKKKEGTALFRGREKTRGRFSWAGLGYSLHPRLSVFKYSIKLKESKQSISDIASRCPVSSDLERREAL